MLVFNKKPNPYQIHFPMTSLIDIVFLLLVYFLLTTNFITEEGIDVNLPNADASQSQSRQELTIVIDSQGKIFISNHSVPLKMLPETLKALMNDGKNSAVIIKADQSVTLDQVVRIMDIARNSGAEKLFIATEKGE